MQKHRRWITLIVLTLLIVVMFFLIRKPLTRNKVVITYAKPVYSSELSNTYKKIIEEFKKAYPYIQVKVIKISKNYESKILSLIHENKAPDVVLITPEMFVTLIGKNREVGLQPLGPFMEEDEHFDIDDYYGATVCMFTYADKLYALPKNMSIPVMMYNKDLFYQERIKYPTDSWTWKDFLNAAQKLTKRNANGKIIQFGTDGLNTFSWILQNGGKIVSDDGKKCLLNEPAAIEAIQFKTDLINKYQVAPTLTLISNKKRWNLFKKNGRVGMWLEMYPINPVIAKQFRFNWDIATLPKNKSGNKIIVSGTALAITSNSKHPYEAWELVKWLSGEDVMRELIDTEMPAIRTLEEDFLDDPKIPGNKQLVINTIKQPISTPQMLKCLQIENIIEKELSNVWLGKETVNEAVKRITNKADNLW